MITKGDPNLPAHTRGAVQAEWATLHAAALFAMVGLALLGSGMADALSGDTNAEATNRDAGSALVSSTAMAASECASLDFFCHIGTAASGATQGISDGLGSIPVLGTGIRAVGGAISGLWQSAGDLTRGAARAGKGLIWDFAINDVVVGTATGVAGLFCKFGGGCKDKSWNPIKPTMDSVLNFVKHVPEARFAITRTLGDLYSCVDPLSGAAAQDRFHACGLTAGRVLQIVYGPKVINAKTVGAVSGGRLTLPAFRGSEWVYTGSMIAGPQVIEHSQRQPAPSAPAAEPQKVVQIGQVTDAPPTLYSNGNYGGQTGGTSASQPETYEPETYQPSADNSSGGTTYLYEDSDPNAR